MAKRTLVRLHRTDMAAFPSNTLLDYYEIIHLLMEAIAVKEGFRMRGEGAHRELIDAVALSLRWSETYLSFVQETRERRNRISYQGFTVPPEWVRQHRDLAEKVIASLVVSVSTPGISHRRRP
ncbi:MAG: hypothetical protein V1735_07730 [Nanoarchaeota archaeon]